MKKTIVFLFCVVLLFSCKKNPVECNTNVTSVSGSYKITAMTYKETPASPEVDFFTPNFDPCQRDDTYTFNANGTYIRTDVALVCNPSGGENGTWALSGNAMTIDGDQTGIESFDCKSLILFNTDISIPGDRLKITMIRQ